MTRRTTQHWALPLGLAFLYVAVLAVTAGLSTRPTQPLFEGVGPSAPYRWVNPPSEFAATNQPPGTLDTTVSLGANGSAPIAAASHDGQIVFNLGAGAMAPTAGATDVKAVGAPVDPATLAALPAPVRPNGNAYRVDFTYLPTDEGAKVAKPGNVVLVVPEAANAIYFSPDGETWDKLATQTLGGPSTVGASLAAPGYYLAGTTASANTGSGGGSSGNSVLVVVAAALVGLVIIVVAARWWRSRSNAASSDQS